VERSTIHVFEPDGKITKLFTNSVSNSKTTFREYQPAGQFDLPGVAKGETLISRDAKHTTLRIQFTSEQQKILDGTSRVTFVVGPRDGWNSSAPTVSRRSLSVRGDVAHATFSNKQLDRVFGNQPLAMYARIDLPNGEKKYINLDNKMYQN